MLSKPSRGQLSPIGSRLIAIEVIMHGVPSPVAHEDCHLEEGGRSGNIYKDQRPHLIYIMSDDPYEQVASGANAV
jgi:hypothetical protein